MTFAVRTLQERAIYEKHVPAIDLTAGEDEIGRAWEDHQAQCRLVRACLSNKIEPDQLLDGLYDVMGKRIDPYLDELIIGLGVMSGHV